MSGIRKILYLMGYCLMISPPRSIDLIVSEQTRKGELAKQPLWMVMLTELLIRIAILLIFAVGIESLMTKDLYETYKLDHVFGLIVILGGMHSLFYYLLVGLFRTSPRLDVAMRAYRLLRNLCYAALPGLLVIVPVLVWKWTQGIAPFADGVVVKVYMVVTLLMVLAGVVEALLMKRKPLGLDRNLKMK